MCSTCAIAEQNSFLKDCACIRVPVVLEVVSALVIVTVVSVVPVVLDVTSGDVVVTLVPCNYK